MKFPVLFGGDFAQIWDFFIWKAVFGCQVLPKRLQLSVALAAARLTEAAGVKVDLEPQLKSRQALHFQEVHRTSIALLISIRFGPTSSAQIIIAVPRSCLRMHMEASRLYHREFQASIQVHVLVKWSCDESGDPIFCFGILLDFTWHF